MSREWTIGLVWTLLIKIFLRGSLPDGFDICTLAKFSVFTKPIWPRLPTGKLAFVDNQVSFQMREAPTSFDLCSVLLASLDDVAACDNQFEYHVDRRLALTNLLAFGLSVRSSDNRLSETWGRAFASIFSFAILNTAADNQSTHCLRIRGMQKAESHNLVLAETFCPGICGDKQIDAPPPPPPGGADTPVG